MLSRPQIRLKRLLAIGLLYLPLAADAFAVTPSSGYDGRRVQCRYLQSKAQLQATVAPIEGSIQPKREEKLTKEAQELLLALETKATSEPDAHLLIVAQVAPSVRLSFPEEFGLEPGAFPTTLLVASLKESGFDLVLDTNTAADLTVCEEGTELLHRLQARQEAAGTFGQVDPGPEPMPLFTSCCPRWMNFIEKSAPELAPYTSTCKSPQMMYGAVLKEFSQEMLGRPADKVYFTSIMPCVRKRGESDHAAFEHGGIRDVDNVITTKDLGQLLRMKGIHPADLLPQRFDSPFQTNGTGTGAGQLFGATGGVMEAAVRTVYEIVTGSTMPRLELDEVRGLEGVKETVITMSSDKMETPINLRVAVVNGLGNVKKLVEKMKAGEVEYDFVEVMACPGGCIGGGGQPKGGKNALDKRLDYMYQLDRSLPLRKSHENPTVKTLYEKYLGEYGGEKAKELFACQVRLRRSPASQKAAQE